VKNVKNVSFCEDHLALTSIFLWQNLLLQYLVSFKKSSHELKILQAILITLWAGIKALRRSYSLDPDRVLNHQLNKCHAKVVPVLN
jgi:hypothetical protein